MGYEMTDLQIRRVERQVKGHFHRYEAKRVSNHLTKVMLPPIKVLKSYKEFLGFKYDREYEIVNRELRFEHSFIHTHTFMNFWHGEVNEYFDVHCAVDEEEQIVYWKAEFTHRTLQRS